MCNYHYYLPLDRILHLRYNILIDLSEVLMIERSLADLTEKAIEVLMTGSSSRKALAESLGISHAAAGEIASLLLSLGIAREYSKRSASRGRRVGILTLAERPAFAVARILPDMISTEFFGYGLDTVQDENFELSDPLFLDDLFSVYFMRIAERVPPLRGICLVCDGIPSGDCFSCTGNPSLDLLPIVPIAREYLGECVIMLENKDAWSVTETDGVSAVITDRDGSLFFRLLQNGIPVCGSRGHIGDVGLIRGVDGTTISSRLRFAGDPQEYVFALSELLHTVILLCAPDRICFTSDKYRTVDSLAGSVYEYLSVEYDMPESRAGIILTGKNGLDPTMPRLRRYLRSYCIGGLIEKFENKK